MKKLFTILCVLLAQTAWAQTPTVQTKSQLYTAIDTQFANNTSGGITPTKLRTITKNIVASYLDGTAGAIPQYSTAIGTGTTFSGAPLAIPATSFAGVTCDGVTDDGAGLQAALDYATANGRTLEFPDRTCVSSIQLVSTNKSVYINGVSQRSAIKFTNAASAGFNITLRAYAAGVYDNANIENLTILAGAVHTDSALKIFLATRVSNAEQVIHVHNVNVQPATFGTFRFASCLRMERVVSGQIDNFQCLGESTVAAAGTTGVYLNSVVGLQFKSLLVAYMETGIRMTVTGGDLASEGIELLGGNIYNVSNGIVVDGTTPGTGNVLDMRLNGIHIAANIFGNKQCLNWDGVYQSTVNNSLFYCGANLGVLLADTVGTTFTGNKIFGVAGYIGTDILVKFTTTSYNNNLTGNYLALSGIGVWFDVGSVSNSLSGNIFNDITTRVDGGAGTGTVSGFNAESCSYDVTNTTQDVLGCINGYSINQGRFNVEGVVGDTSALISFKPSGGAQSFFFQDTNRDWTIQNATDGVIWKLTKTGVNTIGRTGAITGSTVLAGATSGAVTITPQAAAGTFNFNLPTTAGSSGQPLLSGGGGAMAMSWGTVTGTGAFVLATGPTFTSSASGTYPINESTFAGVTGAQFQFYHNSASPAANDVSLFSFAFNNTTPAKITTSTVVGELVDPTAGSEDGRVRFDNMIAGVNGTRFYIGNGIYGGTVVGGDQGADTINMTTYYAAGTAGFTGTKTVRASGGAADCTLVYSGGILTGGTC